MTSTPPDPKASRLLNTRERGELVWLRKNFRLTRWVLTPEQKALIESHYDNERFHPENPPVITDPHQYEEETEENFQLFDEDDPHDAWLLH
jgi:hypothetical protein